MSAARKSKDELAKGFNLPKSSPAPVPEKQAQAFEQAGAQPSPPPAKTTPRAKDEGKAKTRITTYFPPSLAKRLRVEAARRERSMTDLVIEAVESYLTR
jgi:predicted HicB family RNase H-like nuclease